MEAVRKKTLWLLSFVPEEALKVRVHDFYSPIGWHFGHIGRTEEFWISHKAFGRPVIDDQLSFLFADLPENPKDNRVNLPSREQIIEYLEATRARSSADLEAAEFREDNPFLREGYAWDFALQHECQHQETICEMLQLIQKAAQTDSLHSHGARDATAPTVKPNTGADRFEVDSEEWAPPQPSEFIEFRGGSHFMGSDDTCVYDNEHPRHRVEVSGFKLANAPVTAAQWFAFMNDGGYRRQELWSEAGWNWKQWESAESPEYWKAMGEGYAYFGPHGLRPMQPQEPVSSISWFEAEAFLRWAGKRFPTEEEWEYAASFDPVSGVSRRFPWGFEWPNKQTAIAEIGSWSPMPVGSKSCGQSALGCFDMAGNVWEWTSSHFLPYPGFQAFPYDGYSKDHMKGEHFVCRGGSWATAAPILRCSFRNWYVPTYRQGFLGLRCADD